MNRLLEIGFDLVGHWELSDEHLELHLSRHGKQENILYAFVSDGEVKYIGKTIQPLSRRLYAYQNPSTSQSTNIRNNQLLIELLRAGASVDILALPDNGLMHYGQFHLNLASGLEDSLISTIQPDWNGRRSKDLSQDDFPEKPITHLTEFAVTLHKTYFKQGFFNVSVEHEMYFGADGESVEIYVNTIEKPILGTINRRCNTNRTPRILGGTGLRDWFHQNCKMMQQIRVAVIESSTICLSFSKESVTKA